MKHRSGASPGDFELDIGFATVSASDVQWLFSYNSQGYTAGGGDDDPGWSTTANGAGLSVYYRESTDGGFSYGAWTQISSGVSEWMTEATEVVKHQQATFGARDSSGTTPLLSGSEITDLQLWNVVRTPQDVETPPSGRRLAALPPVQAFAHGRALQAPTPSTLPFGAGERKTLYVSGRTA